ncbi:MAG: Holliday junction resolvase RuvX [Rickettsiales bacterium]|jgi:putative Holliday junction resolvase|nr:Holliday junction resolvase RuvX [Rickettsiales bacterium]
MKEFFQNLQTQNKRLLSIDFGVKRIGFAISDPELKIAFPLTVIENKGIKHNVAEIQKILEKNNVGGFLIGKPTKMSGADSDIAFLVENFANHLSQNIGIPILFWDERFSSSVMQRELIENFDMSRQKRKKIIDKLAASYFLQGALDYYNANLHP